MKKIACYILLFMILSTSPCIAYTKKSDVIAELKLLMTDDSRVAYRIYGSDLVPDNEQIVSNLEALTSSNYVKEILLLDGKPLQDTVYARYAGLLTHEKKPVKLTMGDDIPARMEAYLPDNGKYEKGKDINGYIKKDGVTQTKVDITVNGRKALTGPVPYIRNYRTMAPFKEIMEALGADVTQISYDNRLIVARAVLNGTRIDVKTGDSRMYRDGGFIFMDVVPELHNGIIYIPVVFLSDILSMELNWDRENSLVIISTCAGGGGG